MTVINALNPDFQGGTGNFWIRSIMGAQIIDENLIFRVLGIANEIGIITTASIALDSEGVQYAGQNSRYVFIFQTSTFIPDGSFVRLYLPEGEFNVVQFPGCSAYPVSGKIVSGRFTCESFENRYIDVKGFVDKFLPGTSIGIIVTLQNSKYAHITNKFGVAFIRKFTQIMYDRKLDITGVEIKPGIINKVSINQIDKELKLTRNKIMRFELKFTLSNELYEGSVIQLKFPASFQIYNRIVLNEPSTYWIDFGLEDKNEDDPLVVIYDSDNDVLILKNYKPKLEPDEIVFKFWATSPDNPGESSPVEITTYTDIDQTYVIDQDVQFAKISVYNVPTPNENEIILSEDFSGLGKAIDAIYKFNPSTSIPANGFIKIIFDPNLEINEVDVSKCKVWSSASAGLVLAQTCFKRNREIAIQINNEQFTAGSTWSVQLVGLIISPEFSGEYFSDVTFYQEDGETQLNSYTQIMVFRAAKLIFPDVKVYPTEKFERGILDITVTVPFDIPVSRKQNITTETVSFIYVGIEPSGPTSLKTDLGYTRYGVNGRIPCLAVMGLIPVEGSSINCTIISRGSPGIKITNYHALSQNTRIRLIIGDFENPDGNIIINTMFAKKFNRVYTIISSIQITLQINDNSLLPIVSDSSLQDRNSFYTANTTNVGEEFELTFNMNSKKTVNGLERMIFKLPNYDIGFIMFDKQPICLINDLPFTCYGIPYSDWILIELESFQSIAQSKYTIR